MINPKDLRSKADSANVAKGNAEAEARRIEEERIKLWRDGKITGIPVLFDCNIKPLLEKAAEEGKYELHISLNEFYYAEFHREIAAYMNEQGLSTTSGDDWYKTRYSDDSDEVDVYSSWIEVKW